MRAGIVARALRRRGRAWLRRRTAQLAGLLLALVVGLWRLSCRRRVLRDPRPGLRAQGRPYVYALLHGHQVAAVLINDEPQLAAMVSRSSDGDLLVPSLRLRGVRPVRGSSRRGGADKGGSAALRALTRLCRAGVPALLAVDGPRGPRGHVQPGVVALAQRAGACILPVVATARRAHVLRGTWDLMQLPWPGTRVTLRFGAPIWPPADAAPGAVAGAVGEALRVLEAEADAKNGRPTRD